MKKLLVISFVSLFLSGCGSTKNIDKSIEQIGITFEQNGKFIKPLKDKIQFKKEPFAVIIELPKNWGLIINASYKDSISKLTFEGKVPEVFNDNSVIAVDLFNREATLYLSNDSSNAWYHVSDEEHTFNEVEVLNGGHKCRRMVTKIYDADTSINYEIKDMNEFIYLTFAGVNLEGEEPRVPFLIGQNLKIEWKN